MILTEITDEELSFMKAYEAEINTLISTMNNRLAHMGVKLTDQQTFALSVEIAKISLTHFKLGQMYADKQWST